MHSAPKTLAMSFLTYRRWSDWAYCESATVIDGCMNLVDAASIFLEEMYLTFNCLPFSGMYINELFLVRWTFPASLSSNADNLSNKKFPWFNYLPMSHRKGRKLTLSLKESYRHWLYERRKPSNQMISARQSMYQLVTAASLPNQIRMLNNPEHNYATF